MDFTVRQARLGDIPRMCDLLSELFSIESDFRPDREKQDIGLSLLLNDNSGSSTVLVAEKDGEIVGMCSVQTLVSTSEGGIVGLLEDLIVHRDRRGNGVGTKLLFHIVEWCRSKDILRLQLLRDIDNAKAADFYTDKGWMNTNLICMRKFP